MTSIPCEKKSRIGTLCGMRLRSGKPSIQYEKTLFIEIHAEDIAKQAEKYGKIANRLEKAPPENLI